MHIETFNEFVDEILDYFPLELTVQNVNVSTVTHKDLEHADKEIYFVLNKFRKKIEG